MCYPVACRRCGKTTWGGCGRHVDDVMKSVPASESCSCAAVPSETVPRAGFFGSLFRR